MMRSDIDEAKNAVISGSLTGWGDELIPLFTLAVRLETETNLRIQRLRKRERAHFGKRVEEGGDMYENHRDFLEWAKAYDTGGLDMRSKAMHDEWQKKLTCRLIALDGGKSLEHNLELIKEALI